MVDLKVYIYFPPPNEKLNTEQEIPAFNTTDCTLFKSKTIKHNELSVTGILVRSVQSKKK